MAQITNFTITGFNNDGASVQMLVTFSNGDEYRVNVTTDTTLEFLRENVIQEAKRRNKLDTLKASLDAFEGITIGLDGQVVP